MNSRLFMHHCCSSEVLSSSASEAPLNSRKTESGSDGGGGHGGVRQEFPFTPRALALVWLGRASSTLRDAFPSSALCTPNIHCYAPSVQVPSASQPWPKLVLLPEMPSLSHPTAGPGEDSGPGSWMQAPQAQACVSPETYAGPFTSLSLPASVSASIEWE